MASAEIHVDRPLPTIAVMPLRNLSPDRDLAGKLAVYVDDAHLRQMSLSMSDDCAAKELVPDSPGQVGFNCRGIKCFRFSSRSIGTRRVMYRDPSLIISMTRVKTIRAGCWKR